MRNRWRDLPARYPARLFDFHSAQHSLLYGARDTEGFSMTDNPQTTPRRIQRKRTKGWKMPPNTVYVGRPTKWGNPFRVIIDGSEEYCVERDRSVININIWTFPTKADIRRELRGKNLSCWCVENKPCHADVLLEIANGGSL